MDKHPTVDRIFHLCGTVTGAHRVAVALSLLATEAHRIGENNTDLRSYMIQECGLGWEDRVNGGLAASIAFLRYIEAGRFQSHPISVEA